MQIAGSRVLITGASRGIGAALAVALAGSGAQTFLLNARDPDRLDDVAGRVRAARPGAVVERIAGDVADPDTAREIGDRVAALGGLDLALNNAALINEPARLLETDDEVWRRIVDVNVLGMVRIARVVLPHLSGGALLNLSSTWGRVGAARFAPYCTTKFAVEGFSQSVAQEVGDVIVCAVNPGIVATDMLATAFEGATAGCTSPEQCAADFVRLIADLKPSDSGRPLTV